MPKIAILTTGGTIAGSATKNGEYKAGALNSKELLRALNLNEIYKNKNNYQIKLLNKIINLELFELAQIDSCDLNEELWFKMANFINSHDEFDAFIITHGTDTLEESAYFLSLVCSKKIILTGAMRPANSLSADGPRNFLNALILALDEKSRGVLISMNDKIFSAKNVQKNHTLNIDAFGNSTLGFFIGENIFWQNEIYAHSKTPIFDIKNLTKLPRVEILMSYANVDLKVAAKALFDDGARGLIIAGVGAGNIHYKLKNELKNLMKLGLKVVLSSRINFGNVLVKKEDLEFGFISARDLNPQKARILFSLALSKFDKNEEIQKLFDNF